MKFIVHLAVLVWLVFISGTVEGQLKEQCQTCFSSELVQAARVNDQCTDYQIKVFYSGRCDHDLSHFTVAVPTCATITNLSNDLNYSQVFGYDPTTGLTGFKIDNISNFGSSSTNSFLVSFTLCSSSTCTELSCWSPVVAYKASTCFELDTLKGSCANLQAHLVQTNVSCFGQANGSLTAVIDTGVSPYQFSWSTGATSAALVNIEAGNYSVNIIDATGAKLTLSAMVSEPPGINIGSTITNASCSGQSNGSITLTVSGGTGKSYSYLWNSGSSKSNLDSVKAGNYSVSVTDSAGCKASASFLVKNEKQIIISSTQVQPSCNQANGSLSVTASGGLGPYSYKWSTGDTARVIQNLLAGTYSVTAIDAEGCTASASYSLRENNTLRISYNVTPTSCLDDGSGAITITLSGGTPPYTFNWSTGATTKDLQGLTAGTYTLTVTDSAGCQMSARVTVFKKTFQIVSDIHQPLCFSDSTGSIALKPSQGIAPYQFSWSTGSTIDSVGNLVAGTYKVTVTDSTGCQRLLSYTIFNPPQLEATNTVTSTGCNNYSIDLSINGGTKPYQYLWSTGASTEDISGVPPGLYAVTITDAHGCTLQKQVTVDSVAVFACMITAVSQPPSCNSSGNFIVTSVGDATYQWQLTSSDGSWAIQTGAANDTLTYEAGNANTTATFTLTITKNGCTQSCSYNLASCSSSSGGTGGEPNSESCADCFSSTIVKDSGDATCSRYTVNVSTDGNCRYDLSHLVVAIPCGQLSDYSDSGNYPLVVGKDPTTGLTGLKVDNVNGFGKEVRSFTLEFTLCYSSDCAALLENWNPVVAYKAGQCIAYDTLSLSSGSHPVAVFPNPTRSSFSFEIKSEYDSQVALELYNPQGHCVHVSTWSVTAGEKANLKVDASHLQQNVYVYKIKTSTASYQGRVVKLDR